MPVKNEIIRNNTVLPIGPIWQLLLFSFFCLNFFSGYAQKILPLSAAYSPFQAYLRSVKPKTLTTPWPEPLSKSQMYRSCSTNRLRQKDSTAIATIFSYLWENSSSCFLGCFIHSSPCLQITGPPKHGYGQSHSRGGVWYIGGVAIRKWKGFLYICLFRTELLSNASSKRH